MNMKSVRMPGWRIALFVVAAALVAAAEEPVRVEAAISHPVLSAGARSTAYLQVTMTGNPLGKGASRPPVNIALVLDKSGSMQGDKITQAKAAAISLVQRLRPDDIVSVVAYDTNIAVVVPATKVDGSDMIVAGINQIQANGSTALFAGVSKGAAELRKFFVKERVNRILLLSDGLANVGPSTPADLGELGKALGAEGISVTTIGLGTGYNENLMLDLAQKSDGNHIFAEMASDLAHVFDDELGDVLSVAARSIDINIQCADGVRPVRSLGRACVIDGSHVTASLNQLYANQMKYVLLEVEVTGQNSPGANQAIASVSLRSVGIGDQAPYEAKREVVARLSTVPGEPETAMNREIMAQAVRQVGVENTLEAIKLRDAGKDAEATRVFESNRAYLRSNAAALQSRQLEEDVKSTTGFWDQMRRGPAGGKAFKQYQNEVQLQQKAQQK